MRRISRCGKLRYIKSRAIGMAGRAETPYFEAVHADQGNGLLEQICGVHRMIIKDRQPGPRELWVYGHRCVCCS
jgi:hypothetical protein